MKMGNNGDKYGNQGIKPIAFSKKVCYTFNVFFLYHRELVEFSMEMTGRKEVQGLPRNNGNILQQYKK